MNAVPVTPRNALQPPTSQAESAQRKGTPAGDLSRTGTPGLSTATPAQQQSPQEEEAPPLPPLPFAYDYLTEDALESWQENGRQRVLDASKRADEGTLSIVVQELLRSGIDGRLDTQEAGSVIRQIAADRQDGVDVPTLLLNTVSLLDDADTKPRPSEASRLAGILAATHFDPEVMRLDLDIAHVVHANLVRQTFSTIRNRKATNFLYRQANFNLLREESEGYAKLITEYYNTAQEAGGTREAGPNMAEDAFQRVKALVGSFDLDVGRVLDITLDISANALVRSFGFFMTFYRCSSWWPDGGVLDNVKWEDQGFNTFPNWALPRSLKTVSDDDWNTGLATLKETRDQKFRHRVRDAGIDAFFELGARRIIDYDSVAQLLATAIEPQTAANGKEINATRRQRINESRGYMRETRTLPPPGNSDAAQLLGFKLRFYASEARGVEDTMPDNLVHFTALLIKIGFISLRDLYPHLYPPDALMPEEKKRLEKEKADKEAKERPGGGPNALATASALTDDTLLPSQRSRNDKDRSGGVTPKPNSKEDAPAAELPTPTNQKLALLKALLLLGAIPESLYILGRFPWLADVDVTLPPYLHRIVRHMLSRMTEELCPLRDRQELGDPRDQLADTVVQSEGTLRFSARPSKRPIKWFGLDEFYDKDGVEYKHYYGDWSDNIPVCQTADDVFSLCDTFIGYLGVKIGQDTVILGTLVRLAKKSLAEDESEPNRQRWLGLMKRLLVPALSLSKHNPGLSSEVHDLMMFFPITTRYNIYAEWFTGKTSRLPDIRLAFDYNRAEVRDVLRRVSNDNVKQQRNALGKVSHSSPGVLIMYMINQLESYSNMIPSLVECVKHLSPLGLDVLTWCLINSLSGQGRDRMQADGMLTSPWLQALSQFVASLFSHYGNKINPSPVLQYLASELRSGNSTDLEMFEQVLTEMAGIRSDMEFNDAQVLAMSGGEYLRAQILLQVGDKRREHDRKITAKRLIKGLAEPGLIGQTLISIAQERQMYPHHESSKDMPLKVLGNNLDKIHQVFAQYLDVLTTNLTPGEFEAAVPDVLDLIEGFGLEPGVAFTICRNAIAARVLEVDEARKQEELEERKRRLSETRAQGNGEISMKGATVANDTAAAPTPEVKAQVAAPNDAAQESKPSSTVQPTASPAADDAVWHPVLLPIIQRLQVIRPSLTERVSASFFVTFWTLSQSDLVVLTESYHTEIGKLKDQVGEINRDRSNNTSTGARERERKRKALQTTEENLRAEVKGRVAYYTKVSNRLSHKEKYHWFDRSRVHDHLDNKHIALLQECFLPRAMLSSLDAHYSFLMLKLLHDKGTPGFSTMHLMAQLFRKQELAAVIFQCTQLEAQHFGRFLNETLKLLANWHAKQENYDNHAIGKKTPLPGFATKMDANGDPATVLDYEKFRQQVYNWHSFLNGALQACFESGEYMHIRNGIIVLKAIHQNFPALNFHGKNMVSHVTRLSKEDPRQDLKLMAMSLLGPLTNRQKEWVLPQAFRLNVIAKDGKSDSVAPSAKPETPQPGVGAPKLNAAAAEFKPEVSGLANGDARKESVAGIEDGEVEEEKQAAVKNGDAEMKEAPAPEVESKPSEPTPKSTPAVPPKETPKPESKPATPAPASSQAQPPINGDVRQHPGRPASVQPNAARLPQGLPSRPEPQAPPPNKPLPTPPIDRPTGRFPGRADDRYGRLDRPSPMRPGSREHSPGLRGHANTPPATSHSTSRDDRHSQRSGRDDSWAGPRHNTGSPALHSRSHADPRDRANAAMILQPSGQSPHPDHVGFMSSAVSAPSAQSTSRPTVNGTPAPQGSADDTFLNPQRRAMMNGDNKREAHPQEQERQPGRDGKVDRVGLAYPAREDVRPGPRGSQAEPPQDAQGWREPPADLAPSGPRQGRLSRDSRDMNPPPEPTYGRLNAASEVPSGPRASNGPSAQARPGRNFSGPPPPFDNRSSDAPVPSSSAPRPSETPASFHGAARPLGDRRTSGPQFERQPLSHVVPNTPVAETGPAVHPSRAAQLGVQPPPLQTNLPSTNGVRGAGSPMSATPTGPRGPINGRAPVGAPTGPSPIVTAPPAGPASILDRQRRDRQRANINASLAQSSPVMVGPGSNGHNFRGAATNPHRQNSYSMASVAAPPPVQAIASPMEPPAPVRRNDGPPSRPESRTEPRADLFQRNDGPDARGDDRARRREDERSERFRVGGHPGHEHRPDDEQLRRPPQFGVEESRDKRGPPREDRRPREDRESRDGSQRERHGARGARGDEGQRQMPPDMLGSFGPGGPPRDYNRGSARHGPEESRRGGRSSGRGEDFRGPRREDERVGNGGRGPLSREEMASASSDGRKRRHEEAGGGPFVDESKRRRSGR